MKDIFEWGECRRSKRNYTVYDLLQLKGKKKLTQVNMVGFAAMMKKLKINY